MSPLCLVLVFSTPQARCWPELRAPSNYLADPCGLLTSGMKHETSCWLRTLERVPRGCRHDRQSRNLVPVTSCARRSVNQGLKKVCTGANTATSAAWLTES